MKRIYISGPMTGLPDDNRAEFFAAARKLKEKYPDCLPVPTAWCDGKRQRSYFLKFSGEEKGCVFRMFTDV